MPPKRINLSAEAAAAERNAQHELSAMRSALREAEDNIAGLHRMLKVPVPKGGSRTIKGTRSSPGLLQRAAENSFGGFLGNALLGEAGIGKNNSFYTSSSQTAAQYSDLSDNAQRIS